MNPDLHNSDDSFDELLAATLSEYATDQPRPDLDRRILASLPPQRTPIRWPLWASLATALAIAIVAISHRPSPTRVPHDHAAPSVASSEVIVGTLPTRPDAYKESSSRPKRQTASPSVAQWRDPRSLPPQILPAFTEADAAIQTPPPTRPAGSDSAIEPIQISSLEVPPLPEPDASPQIPPALTIDPIVIAAIQIPSLETDPLVPNP